MQTGVKAHRNLEEQVRWEYLVTPLESSKIKELLINSTQNVTYIPTAPNPSVISTISQSLYIQTGI